MEKRSVPEWIAASPDSEIPRRVRLRLFERAAGRCQICTRKLGPGDGWQADHIVALINGGANAEANLQVACTWCHAGKTRADVAEKAKTARIRAKHLGLKNKSRFPNSRDGKYRTKLNGGTVLR